MQTDVYNDVDVVGLSVTEQCCRLAQTMQLKTRSYGKNEDRRLVVFKALSLPMLMESLVACSGSNAKYTLVPPTPDDGDTGQW